MKIEKAIEILQAIIETGDYLGEPGDLPALELGIQALKRILQLRRMWGKGLNLKLAGETKE